MGLCASAEAVDTKKAEPSQEKKQQIIEPSDVQLTVNETAQAETDDDFRLIFKDGAILILDNLAKALEYEKDGYQEAALKKGHKNYMDIMAPSSVEAALKEILDVQVQTASKLPADDINYIHDNFRFFLEACRSSPFKDPAISKPTIASVLQKATTATQKSLQDATETVSASDLKLHIFFFINALNTLQGDLVGSPGTLYRNVESLVRGEHVGGKPA